MCKLYGDGIHDDTLAIQQMIDSGKNEVSLPAPEKFYLISKPLELPSNFSLVLPRYAEVRLAAGSNCVMLKNKTVADYAERIPEGESDTAKQIWSYLNEFSPDAPCENIEVRGGVWNCNNMNQATNPEQTKPEGWVKGFYGCGMLFYNVKNFKFSSLTIKDPSQYGVTLDKVSYFTVEDIIFDYNLGNPMAINMDGIHLDGNCHYGVIKNLKGTCYDDLVALNAHEGSRGPITNILIDGLFAENCHSAVRLLSADENEPVKNIHITNVYGTYYQYAIGLTKYYPGDALGHFDAITLDNIYISKAPRTFYPFPNGYVYPLIFLSRNVVVKSLKIDGLHRRENVTPVETFHTAVNSRIDRLILNDVTVENHTGEPMPFIFNQGIIKDMSLSHCDWGDDEFMIDNGTVENKTIN